MDVTAGAEAVHSGISFLGILAIGASFVSALIPSSLRLPQSEIFVPLLNYSSIFALSASQREISSD